MLHEESMYYEEQNINVVVPEVSEEVYKKEIKTVDRYNYDLSDKSELFLNFCYFKKKDSSLYDIILCYKVFSDKPEGIIRSSLIVYDSLEKQAFLENSKLPSLTNSVKDLMRPEKDRLSLVEKMIYKNNGLFDAVKTYLKEKEYYADSLHVGTLIHGLLFSQLS